MLFMPTHDCPVWSVAVPGTGRSCYDKSMISRPIRPFLPHTES